MIYPDKTIYTDRLILRLFKEEDFEMYSKFMTNSLVSQYLGNGHKKTSSDIKQLLSYLINIWKENNYGVWAVLDKDTQQIIGHCGFLPVNKSTEIELLYAFDTKVWGKGYATEAALAVINFAKSSYDWTKIIAMAYPENNASIHVIEKLGFEFNGIIDEYNKKLNLYTLDLTK